MGQLIFILCLLILGLVFGTFFEKKHFKSLSERDQKFRGIILSNKKDHSFLKEAQNSALVTGHAVIALDYFKRFAAILTNLIGGRVKSYESLLVRARREAILRMKEKASLAGFDTVINVKIETSNIGGSAGKKNGLGAIEVFAYGTAVKRS